MKNESLGSNSAEAPTESSDKKDKKEFTPKKKRFLPEAVIEEKPAPEEKTFSSIFKREKLKLDTDEAEAESDNEEAEDAGEEAAPLEELGEEDSKYVQKTVAENNLAEIRSSDVETQEELAWAAEMLELVAHDYDPDVAAEKVLIDKGVDPAELATLGPEEEQADEPEADGDSEPEIEEAPAEATEIADDESIDLRQPRAQPSGTGSRGGGSNGRGGSGGGTTPPPPPIPPASSSGSSAGGGFNASAGNFAPTPNAASPNVMPSAAQNYYEYRRRATGAALWGGLVGYLIGRRRGRIKTEKRLLPVQAKLEKQVHELSQKIEIKERQLVRLKMQHETTKPQVRQERSTVRAERMQPSRVETRLEVQKPARAEQLGHMIVSAEAPKRIMERPGNIREAFRAEEVKTMNRSQMLELSEKIIIEGASLRHIYESNLVGERQLRHLVSEYLQGHDIRDELRRHMVEHEIDFERDPMMRDRIRERIKTGGGAAGGLTQLLADAGLANSQADPNLQRQIEKAEQKRAAEQQRQHRQRIATDVAMATALVTMAVAVIVLALGR